MSRPEPLFARGDAARVAGLVAIAGAIQAATIAFTLGEARIPFSALSVYFDGHVYLEIAKSFPLPYAPAGRDYVGHAPGYPALIYLFRLLVPASVANWGTLTMLASALPAL